MKQKVQKELGEVDKKIDDRIDAIEVQARKYLEL